MCAVPGAVLLLGRHPTPVSFLPSQPEERERPSRPFMEGKREADHESHSGCQESNHHFSASVPVLPADKGPLTQAPDQSGGYVAG